MLSDGLGRLQRGDCGLGKQGFKETMNVFHKDKNDDTNHVLAAHNGFWALFDTEHKAAFMERSPTGKPTSTAQKSCII